MTATRAWDLGSGRPVRLERRQIGGEMVVAYNPDPFVDIESLAPMVTSGHWAVDVHNLDPRLKLVATSFFRRCGWTPARLATGEYSPVPQVEGEGFTAATVTAKVIRKDSATGNVHIIGALPSGYWLNAGVVPDGIEIQTAAAGIRIELDFAIIAAPWRGMVPSWDLCLGLEVIPDQRLGCSELPSEIIESLVVNRDSPVQLCSSTYEGTLHSES